ncbi:MAG: ACP phosphodiesterase [Geitlerinemataceae cyanobacterium]
MNYLAHLYLAGSDDEARLGNFLGDFVKGTLDRQRDRYSAAVLEGIACHRAIDAFTDAHPVCRRSCARLDGSVRRVAGIAIDLAYDRLLVEHWARFTDVPFSAFVGEAYALLDRNVTSLPPRLRAVLPSIVAQDWLGSYATWDGIELALRRVSRRFRRSPRLEGMLVGAWPSLFAAREGLSADFLEFFPQAIAFVAARDSAQNQTVCQTLEKIR